MAVDYFGVGLMRGCELIWGAADAQQVQALVEKALGRDCPCKVGVTCPLLGGAAGSADASGRVLKPSMGSASA